MDEFLPAFLAVFIFQAIIRSPTRLGRRLLESHPRLLQKLIGLERVALHARSDDVFPCRLATPCARNDVIEIQFFFRQRFGAILAGEFVAQKNIGTRKLHLFSR